MVVLCWLILWLGTASAVFGEVRVQAEADKSDHFENLPVRITIMITHPADEGVDASTFVLGKEGVVPDKIKDVGDDEGAADIISIYQLDIPSRSKGLHVLPAVSVKVGGKVYKSVASTFEVKGMEGSAASPPAPSSSSAGAFLKLENIIQGPTTLFPGQTLVVGYRYSFNANIETTEEITPLFLPQGFLKVGDKLVNNKDTGDVSVLEATQKIQAETPGVYQVGPSSIEGVVYTEDSLGRRTYAKNKLKSIAPAVTLTIKPLPQEDKPASFNGAIGKYTFKVSLKSPPSVTVGDEMTLLVEISGSGNLETLQMPELCCQPGMSGIFKLSDLPPVGKIEGNTKRFTVTLRPLTAAVKAIPALEFSSFDPASQKFEVLRSAPIAISVAELKTSEEQKPENLPAQSNANGEWQQAMKQPLAIEVGGNYQLTGDDLQDLWFGSWWTLLLLPLGIGLLIYQENFKNFMAARKSAAPTLTSAMLYQQAWQEKAHTSAFYTKLYQAFFMRLQERDDINLSVDTIEKLPLEGAAGDVKALLTALEEARYAADKGVKEELLLEQLRRLFKELGDG